MRYIESVLGLPKLVRRNVASDALDKALVFFDDFVTDVLFYELDIFCSNIRVGNLDEAIFLSCECLD